MQCHVNELPVYKEGWRGQREEGHRHAQVTDSQVHNEEFGRLQHGSLPIGHQQEQGISKERDYAWEKGERKFHYRVPILNSSSSVNDTRIGSALCRYILLVTCHQTLMGCVYLATMYGHFLVYDLLCPFWPWSLWDFLLLAKRVSSDGTVNNNH